MTTKEQPVSALPASTFTPSPENLIRLALDPAARPGLVGNLGRYEILKLIGSGGMGVVLLAREVEVAGHVGGDTRAPRASRLVAIKMIKPELAVESRAVHRFLKEARHMQRLSHPNIVPVLEIAEHLPAPYFVMPYVERGSLATLLANRRPIEEERVLNIARQIAAAIAHAHSKGLIHRDLKPGNILLDADEHAYLSDFGLARTLFNDSLLDVTIDHRAGTAPYMSPTVAAGEAEDTRCDIYSFGALLYEMLTGRPPFEGETTQRVLELIQAGPPRPIIELNPGASPNLVTIAQGAMARELRCRYSQMGDVLVDLDRVAQHEPPVTALNLPRATSARQTERKRTPKVMLVGMIGTMVLAAGVWLSNRRVTTVAQGPSLVLTRKIEVPGVWKWAEARVGRWRTEQERAIFVPLEDKLLVVSGDGLVMGEWRTPEAGVDSFHLDLLSDATGNGLDEPVVSWRVGTTLNSAILNHNLFPLKRFTTEGAIQRPVAVEIGHSAMKAWKVADLKQDGKREFLASVVTGYALKPRGLYCFDYESQSLLWHHDTGPSLTEIELIDLTGDGDLEIVFGTHAVNNGNRADDGTDDGYSYVYALSSDGNLLWKRELEGPYSLTHALVGDLDGNGTDELLVWVSGAPEFRRDQATPEVGVVLRLDAEGQVLASHDFGARLISCTVADLDGDGADEVIATDRRGLVQVLNSNLTPRAVASVTTNEFHHVQLRIAAIADLDHDGHAEIILTSSQEEYVSGLNQGNPTGPANIRFYHDNCIVVLAHDLKPMARYLVARKWNSDPGFDARVATLDPDANPKILALSNEALVLEYKPAKR